MYSNNVNDINNTMFPNDKNKPILGFNFPTIINPLNDGTINANFFLEWTSRNKERPVEEIKQFIENNNINQETSIRNEWMKRMYNKYSTDSTNLINK